MRMVRSAIARVLAIFGRRQAEADLAAELESHLAMRSDDHVRAGLTPQEARRLALIESGGIEAAKEAYRDQRALPVVETAIQDLRYGLRTLRKNAAFTTTAVLTLALGIGASVAMFSVAHAILWRPLPYAAPDRLVDLSEINPLKKWTHAPIAPANFADWRKMNTVFSAIAGYQTRDFFYTGQGDPQRLRALVSTGNLFDVLGVKPLIGRAFQESETYDGNDRVVILGWGLWQSAFNGDASVVGRRISLTGRDVEIIGVMPREFFFGDREIQLYAPLGVKPSVFIETRRPHWMYGIARLKDGVTIEHAGENMRAVARRLEETYPASNTQMGVRLEDYHTSISGEKRPALRLLLSAVAVLFLIVCSNVANLQLGRSAARTREIGIRQALGAGRGRLIRQFLTESLVLSVAGGAAGFGLALLAVMSLEKLAPAALPGFAELKMDGVVLTFAAIVTVLAPILFGIIPAMASARPEALRDRSDTAVRGGARLRRLFVACQIGFSVMLVVGAGLLIRTLVELDHVQLGFQPQRAVSFHIRLPRLRYEKEEQVIQAMQRIEDRLGRIPGVEAVGASMTLPLKGYGWTADATLEGQSGDDYQRELRHDVVTADYFRAIGTRLIAGRGFNQHDDRKSEPVTVVNHALEQAYFQGESAVGRRIKFGRPTDSDPWFLVVGVVEDVKQGKVTDRVLPEAFSYEGQAGAEDLQFVIRGSSPESLMAAARREVHAIDADLALTDTRTLEQLARESLGDQRFRTALLSSFGGIALFLAALGVYGVLAYSVTQRSREIGVRMALGASAPGVFGMVLNEGLRPVAVGLAGGLAGAIALGGLVQSLLFGVTPFDALTLVLTVVVVGTVALGACMLPALAAVRVDPMISLREQ